ASKAAREFNLILMSAFAFVALVLASVGIYGVISYSVTQRTSEFGVRLALGARPGNLTSSVVKQGLAVALIGSVIGLVAAFALTRLMTGLLFGVSAVDPLTFTAVTLLLMAIALAASYIPARKAARTDPLKALRTE
ncbi:MAG TPA: FtsX-like permease family protein, partial [Blastocatellia bacterium]